MGKDKFEHEKMADVDNMEIEPLSDELLETVAGGNSNADGCSCQLCTYTCPKIKE